MKNIGIIVKKIRTNEVMVAARVENLVAILYGIISETMAAGILV